MRLLSYYSESICVHPRIGHAIREVIEVAVISTPVPRHSAV
jgi:hypothetical protein